MPEIPRYAIWAGKRVRISHIEGDSFHIIDHTDAKRIVHRSKITPIKTKPKPSQTPPKKQTFTPPKWEQGELFKSAWGIIHKSIYGEEHDRIHERAKKAQALADRGATEGERTAAKAMADKLHAKASQLRGGAPEPAPEPHRSGFTGRSSGSHAGFTAAQDDWEQSMRDWEEALKRARARADQARQQRTYTGPPPGSARASWGSAFTENKARGESETAERLRQEQERRAKPEHERVRDDLRSEWAKRGRDYDEELKARRARYAHPNPDRWRAAARAEQRLKTVKNIRNGIALASIGTIGAVGAVDYHARQQEKKKAAARRLKRKVS